MQPLLRPRLPESRTVGTVKGQCRCRAKGSILTMRHPRSSAHRLTLPSRAPLVSCTTVHEALLDPEPTGVGVGYLTCSLMMTTSHFYQSST